MGRDDRELDLALYNTAKSNGRKQLQNRPVERDRRSNRNEYEEYRSGKSGKSGNADRSHNNGSSRKKRKKKKRRKALKVFFVLFVFLLIFAAGTAAAIKYVPGAKKFILSNCGGTLLKCFMSEETYNNIFDDTFDKDDIVVNDGMDKNKFTGYYTLALFGIDSRDETMDAGVNSDSIIIVSINQDTGKVVMSSIYRDTWLNIPSESGYDEDYFRKINSAFCSGGVKTAINTLNSNFDLNISDYVTINFEGLATIIDMLGGLDMNITDEEVYYINGYLEENRKITGMDAPDVTQSGNVHLTGLQATAYCRIRYCAFYDESGNKYVDDMGRTARQRYVLSLMVDKAKAAGVTKLLDIAEQVFSGEENIIRTSIAYDDMMEMIPTFIDFELGETKGFPFTYAYPDAYLTNGESAVAVGGLTYNVRLLHRFLYDDTAYTPSARVQQINDRLYEITGVGEILMPEDK